MIREKVWKFYLNRTLYIAVSAATILCYLTDAVNRTLAGETCGYAWIFFALAALMQWAFLSGQINVQKMLFGAMLMAMIKEQMELLTLNASYAGGWINPLDVVILVFSVIIFCSHMRQQMDHTGRTFGIILNQMVGFIGIIFLISALLNTFFTETSFVYNIFAYGYFFNCLMVICMETRVETYKQIRTKAMEEGTWTEENRQKAKGLFRLDKPEKKD